MGTIDIHMVLIETYLNETPDAFKTAVEDILTHLGDEPKDNWWYPFKVGNLYELQSRLYREFDCDASSVSCHMLLKASKEPGLSRAFIITGKDINNNKPAGQLYIQRQSSTFDPGEIKEVS